MEACPGKELRIISPEVHDELLLFKAESTSSWRSRDGVLPRFVLCGGGSLGGGGGTPISMAVRAVGVVLRCVGVGGDPMSSPP